MKNTLTHLCLLILLTFTSENYSQQSLKFDDGTIESVLKRSKVEKKPVFLMIYATWCSHCNKMKKEVFNNPDVIQFFKDNYIATWADGETDKGKALKEKYNLKSYPVFVFIDKNGTNLYKLAGEFTAQQLIAEAKNALNPEKQLPYLEKQFNSDPSNADKCLAYITMLLKAKNRQELAVPTHKYLSTQSDTQLLSETNWRVISNGVSDIDSREFQYVLKNKAAFEKLTSPDRVNRKIENIVTEFFKQYFDKPDMADYKKKREMVKAINLPNTNSLLFKYDLDIAAVAEDWEFYKATATASADKIAGNDASQLKDIAQTYLDNVSDPSSLNQAATWMERAITLDDSYGNRILLSNIYKKADNTAKAKEAATGAKKLATNMGWDSKEADAILKELK